ncbi:hypothetical protein ALC56_10084 [Trachymyrmex septentrionalis]|uniref:Uncharacterized protein n=1 Tax=Trachymyrmex septentrionalis TaxID=34720 RepID=A0A195F5S1_9HYME|nr:hypothetical protein ALC56_10084 [Trachymyrmex septentrionalis]
MQTRAETPLVTVDFSKAISCTRYTARISSYPGARMCKSMPVNRKSSGYSRIFAGSEIPMTLSDATDSSTASALSDVTPNPRQRFVSACCNEMRNSSPQLSEDVATLGLAINTSDFFALRAGTAIDSYLRVVKAGNLFIYSPQTKLRHRYPLYDALRVWGGVDLP